MSKKNLLVVLLAMMLVCVMSVAGTIAWLQADTDPVVNTFTVGDVKFDENLEHGLDEAVVDVFGAYKTDVFNRDIENTYKLIPGQSYIKDPTIHLAAENEPAYVFVEVINPIVDIEADTTIAAQMTANGWSLLGANYPNIYVYKDIVHTLTDGSETQANLEKDAVAVALSKKTVAAGSYDIPVFATFTLKNNADVAGYAAEKIEVKAFIIQANNFANAEAAWIAGSFETIATNP